MPQPKKTQPDQPAPFYVPVDGKAYTLDDLTYAERLRLRDSVRQTMGNPQAEISDVFDDADIVPPLIWLIRLRTDPGATLEDAQKITPAEFEADVKRVDPPKAPDAKGAAS